MATEVVMPQMGESIAEGTITKWLKNVGDHIDRDEPLFEISTDKVDAEIPSPAAGTLTEIKFKEGETVEVNTVVAVLDGEGVKPATVETAEGKSQETPEPVAAEMPKPESPPAQTSATVERPRPVITTQPERKLVPPPPAQTHKTEVKPLVRKSDGAERKPTELHGDGGASAEELRRTK